MAAPRFTSATGRPACAPPRGPSPPTVTSWRRAWVRSCGSGSAPRSVRRAPTPPSREKLDASRCESTPARRSPRWIPRKRQNDLVRTLKGFRASGDRLGPAKLPLTPRDLLGGRVAGGRRVTGGRRRRIATGRRRAFLLRRLRPPTVRGRRRPAERLHREVMRRLVPEDPEEGDQQEDAADERQRIELLAADNHGVEGTESGVLQPNLRRRAAHVRVGHRVRGGPHWHAVQEHARSRRLALQDRGAGTAGESGHGDQADDREEPPKAKTVQAHAWDFRRSRCVRKATTISPSGGPMEHDVTLTEEAGRRRK